MALSYPESVRCMFIGGPLDGQARHVAFLRSIIEIHEYTDATTLFDVFERREITSTHHYRRSVTADGTNVYTHCKEPT